MSTLNFEIVKYSDSYRNQLLEVWEQSVLASHHFLDPKDFESIKKLVNTIDFNSLMKRTHRRLNFIKNLDLEPSKEQINIIKEATTLC